MKEIFALLVFLLLLRMETQSQSLTFDHLTIDQGLSNNTVYAITEDQDGFLWVGTRDGLNRYDGYEFQIFKADPTDSLSLTSNNIQSLFKHPSGDLWVGLRMGGLCILERASKRFRVNPFVGQIYPDWASISIHAIFQDSKGYIWLGTAGNGVVRIDPKLQTLEYFGSDAANKHRRLVSDACFSFVEDSQSNIWMGTSEGQVHCYNRQKDSIEVIYGRPDLGFDLNSYTKSLLLKDRVLWIGTEGNGLLQYDLSQKKFIKKALGATLIKDLKLNGNMVLIATDGAGLFITRDNGNSFQSVKSIPNLVNSLNTNALFNIFIDRNKNMWIGSFNGGLNIHKPNKTEFLSYAEAPSPIAAPGNQSVLAFHEDKAGFIWIGKDGGGLLRFDPVAQTYTKYSADPQQPNSISSNVVTSVYEDSKDNLWIGTFSYGLNLFDRKKNTIETFQYDPNDIKSISNNNVWAIQEDKSGNLWIGTLGGGLLRFDYENEQFISFLSDPKDAARRDMLADRNIRTLLVDEDNQLWIGTELSGLFKRDPDSGVFTNWQVHDRDSSSFHSNTILCLHQDRKSRMWVGTEGGGLYGMLEDRKSFKHYSIKNGLPSNVIHAIEEDVNGVFWISTNQGIASFNAESGAVTTYDKYDGLQSNQFNPSASLTTRSGEVYFGGIYGINSFRPENVHTNPRPPDIVFTDFKLFNKSLPIGAVNGRIILPGPLNEKPEIRLNYFDNVFTIEFAALDFTNPSKNQYRYRLDGFQDEWITVSSNQRYATYTNLDPGKYTFQVIAANNSGVWNEQPAELLILVSPPFWETWWFRLLITLLVVGLIALYIYYLDNKQKEAHQKALLKSEQEILQLKNERLSVEVEEKNAQLSAALLQSAHKNNSLDGLKRQLNDIGQDSEIDAAQKREIRQLVRKIDFELSSEDYWEQFQLNFDQVHQQFSKKLHQRHPQLSGNDIRLCCLLRINMTNKEIAAIQNISLGAVEKSKYRLKKKLDLQQDGDLNLYVIDLA